MCDRFIAKNSETVLFVEQEEGLIGINSYKQRLSIDFFDIFLDDSLLFEDFDNLLLIKIFKIFFTVNFI